FQSTHPCGVRLEILHIKNPYRVFQSTHPCGVRQIRTTIFSTFQSFNPRTRVGCDLKYCILKTLIVCFNP
ncbi:hypothetical protein ACYT6K_11110, partial [Streptococcus pyogenes]